MNPEHEVLIDQTLIQVREAVSTELELLESQGVREDTVDAITDYASVALAESDEPVSVRERVQLARSDILSNPDIRIMTKVKAIKVGRRIICGAFQDAGFKQKAEARRIEI